MFRLSYSDMVENFHLHVMTLFVNASSLQLTLVTLNRLMLNIAAYTYGLIITHVLWRIFFMFYFTCKCTTLLVNASCIGQKMPMIPFSPPPPPKEKQLEYCSSDGFQIVLFQNIPQYFYYY